MSFVSFKKRRGNLMITLFIFFVLVIVLTSLFGLTAAQKHTAYSKASNMGDTNSYISVARLCADSFVSDLETRTANVLIAPFVSPDAETDLEAIAAMEPETTFEEADLSYDLSVYDQAIDIIQNGTPDTTPKTFGLKMSGGVSGTTEWYHFLRDPKRVFAENDITDVDTKELVDRLFEDATVEVKVYDNLQVSITDDDDVQNVTGDTLTIDPVYFSVTLTRGTVKVEQEYRLSGEKIVARYGTSLLYVYVDGSNATCELIRQNVSRRNAA